MANEMLCELCFPKGVEIARIGSSVWLFENEGQYGLMAHDGHKDQHLLFFPEKPYPDPDPEELDESDEWPWMDAVERLEEVLKMPAGEGYVLISSCIEAGWSTERQAETGFTGCRFGCWLFHYCGTLIQNHGNGTR